MELPRLGFVGWLGPDALDALRSSGRAMIAAIADPSERVRSAACLALPEADAVPSLERLVDLDLDAVVIAAPSAFSAFQAMVVLEQGLSVFCPLPIGRSAREATNVIEAAERRNRRMGVDRNLRHSSALQEALSSLGELGQLSRIDIELISADRACGLALVDAVACLLRGLRIESARASYDRSDIELDCEDGIIAHVACMSTSEELSTIRVEVQGTQGQLELESHAEPRGGRALIEWTKRLARNPHFSADEVDGVVETASILDTVYRAPAPAELLSPSLRTATA